MAPHGPHLLLVLLISAAAADLVLSQPKKADPGCNGISLTYNLDSTALIRPYLTNPKAQPRRFSATATVVNNGLTPLLDWALLLSFSSNEILVSIDGASMPDSPDLPFNTSTVESPVSLTTGGPLLTPIATAGNPAQTQSKITIVGTLFGPPALPSSISLDDPSFLCPKSAAAANTSISACCVPNPKFKPNSTIDDPLAGANSSSFARPRSGDLTIDYDVIQAFGGSYLALVKMKNHHPLGRLSSWRLSFNWTRGEFIYSLKGAYTNVTGAADCILGPQGVYYQDLDFTQVENCQRRPWILDLPLDRTNDTAVGRIPGCCRNGSILPVEMDPSQSWSAFQMQVYKMPPDLNRTVIFPPNQWRVVGGPLDPDYTCSPPLRVKPTTFPDPSGLQSESIAIASWQVVCNITKPKGASPKCCVSFSGFYNESIIPCKTCACGCSNTVAHTCSAKAPALLLPSQALLVPFENRTALALEWANLKHFNVPRPMPCPDSCGVSINWHINSDYGNGWTARMTLFNWGEDTFADWFAAIQMDKAYAGFEAMYSFNGTAIGDDTIFMQGLPGLNYLVSEVNGTNPGDPRVPGKQQSVISFTKKTTRDINVVGGDGFPTKVIFNGEECSLPDIIPMAQGFRQGAGGIFGLFLLLVATAYFLLEQ